MALNPVAYTEKVFRSFLRYQISAYPFAAPHLHEQMRALLSLDETRQSPLLKGPYMSVSRPFRQGVEVADLVREGLLHPHLRERISEERTRLYGHQERAIRAVVGGRTTLVSTGTGSGKTECFLYPIVSRCLELRDEGAAPGISAVIVYPMNALAEDQLMRLRGLLAGTGIPFGLYVGKTPEGEAQVTGVRLPPGATRADYEARLDRARRAGSGETVHPAEEVCSREVMRAAGRQPRILLTNVKQLELLLTRQQDIELFAGARLDYLVFDEAHTFTGALGAEAACLIRRLRAFCPADRDATTCVATSATIVDRDDPEAARRFAARFFGVEATAVEPIGEDYKPAVWASPRFAPKAPSGDASELLERAVRAVEREEDSAGEVASVYRSLSGRELGAGADGAPGDEAGGWPEALHAALAGNELVFRLSGELAEPKALDALPAALERRIGRPVTEAEILAWLTLGAAARRRGRPLLRPVLHGFVRGIGGAVVSFPEGSNRPQLWLAAEDLTGGGASDSTVALFRVTTCTTCGQHYFIAFLKDFSFAGKNPGGGDAGTGGVVWPRLDETRGGKRVVLFDTLIGSPDEDDGREKPTHKRAALLHLCRRCGSAHAQDFARCGVCGTSGDPVRLHAVRSDKDRPGSLKSCLSCGALRRQVGGRSFEPARPVRAVNVADVHVLTQDMVHHADRRRLLVFCDNRQDAAFQAGWMKDHARRFRLRALMAEGIRARPSSVGDLVGHLDEVLNADEPLSRALIPEVWEVARLEAAGVLHRQQRRKYLRFQVLREVALSSRQALGLEPWGRMKIEYHGLDASLPWIQEEAHRLGLAADRLRDGIGGALDYLRRKCALYDPEYRIFTRYWMKGDTEIQRGYLPAFTRPNATKLRREANEEPALVTQWLSDRGDTTMRQLAGKWGAAPESVEPLLTGLFDFLVERELLVPVRLLGSRGNPVPGVSSVYQVSADRLLLAPNRGVHRCRRCRHRFSRQQPLDRCPAWRCSGDLEWVPEDPDNYNLALLDGAYSMLRPEEHTAMVPAEERERLENLFKGQSEAVNCLVCTPTLELGIDIGRLDSVLMRNVPPLPANYWQRAGRAGRRHRMAVDITYCRPASHDRAYFAEPEKLLAGRIDPPAFNLRNAEMVAKHVHATVIARLHQYGRDPARSETERETIRAVLEHCLPRRVTPYLFDDGEVRTAPFDLGPLRTLVADNRNDLAAEARRVFRRSWPEQDGKVVTAEALEAQVAAFTDRLEEVVGRLARRLRWAMQQIRRLNAQRERQGALETEDEALSRRCDRLVKRLKGRPRPRSQAEGHDDINTFSVLAAEGFLPGYGLEVGSVTGFAEIPFWRTGGAKDFVLPRPPATALREYVPGNLIYANGHRFAARRFHRDPGEEREEMPYYEVSVARQAVREAAYGRGSTLDGEGLRAMAICDTDLVHQSHISDEEDLRFQLGVSIYGLERDQHGGGRAYRWGSRQAQFRRGVRMRLVNVGPSSGLGTDRGLGYPVCTVCGQSVSPLASERQLTTFRADHAERCGRSPKNIGFFADAVADAFSLPEVTDAPTSYSVLEALRLAATHCLDMHREDLQILVIGRPDREEVDALLWDPMPGGSGLLDRLVARFGEIVPVARKIVADCPGACAVSCVDCLQSFRNAYYHRHLDRRVALRFLDEWGTSLAFEHEIPPLQPAAPSSGGGVPANEAETRLRHLLLAAGFGEGLRGEQIRLGFGLGTTTPDVIYRSEAEDGNEGVCLYLDGLSRGIHGNPETAEKDRTIRDWLRNHEYEVIEIAANQLGDRGAMIRHFRRLAGYLNRPELRKRVRDDDSWFSGR